MNNLLFLSADASLSMNWSIRAAFFFFLIQPHISHMSVSDAGDPTADAQIFHARLFRGQHIFLDSAYTTALCTFLFQSTTLRCSVALDFSTPTLPNSVFVHFLPAFSSNSVHKA
jgi:predicted small integral membrane protein